MEARHRKANRLDPNPLTHLIPLCLNFMNKNKKKRVKLSYVCPIIMNFSEDRGVGIIYLPTKFQLRRLIRNRDLVSDRNRWKHSHTHTHSQTDRRTHTHTS